jgi:hypothetical protein
MTTPVTSTTSTDAAATQAPWSRNIISVPNGDLVLIYQSGAGLKMEVSTDSGATWSVTHTIDSKVDVYASAVLNPNTYDIHVVYSTRGNPATADESVYYRPLIWDGTSDWSIGAEEILAGSNSFNDYTVAGRRNATISAGADGCLIVTYLRNAGGIVTWAALIGNAIWTTSEFDPNSNVGLLANAGSRGGGLQTSARTLWFLSRTGSSYNLSYQTAIPALADVDLITDAASGAWLGDAGEHFAFVYAARLNQIGVVYLKAANPYLRLYNVATGSLIGETKLSSSTCDSVSITWDGERFWMAWVSADTVTISASDAPTTPIITFSSGGSEGWSWLNAPIDASFHLFVWSQTNGGPSTVYSGQEAGQAISFSAADTGAGVDEIVAVYLPAEAGVAVDVAVVIVRIAATESGVGSDVVTGGPLATDNGVGADTVSVLMPPAVESGVGRDTVSVLFTAAETAQGIDDIASLVQIQSVADGGIGTDDVNQLLIAVADRGSGVDAANSHLFLVVETAAGQDVVVIIQTVTDSGTGTDDIVMYPTVHDFGVGADDTPITKEVPDTGQGTDVVVVLVTVTDSGDATESASD